MLSTGVNGAPQRLDPVVQLALFKRRLLGRTLGLARGAARFVERLAERFESELLVFAAGLQLGQTCVVLFERAFGIARQRALFIDLRGVTRGLPKGQLVAHELEQFCPSTRIGEDQEPVPVA